MHTNHPEILDSDSVGPGAPVSIFAQVMLAGAAGTKPMPLDTLLDEVGAMQTVWLSGWGGRRRLAIKGAFLAAKVKSKDLFSSKFPSNSPL